MQSDNKPSELEDRASPVEVVWPPILANMPSGRYAISGATWLRVPDDTTREDLPRYMVVKAREPDTEATDAMYEVQGSKGNVYVVKIRGNQWSCTCPGFGWRQKCRHIAGLK